MSKKEELLMNAAKIINDEGMHQLTMDYLAKQTDMTKGGILYHFESKDHLLLSMNDMIIGRYEDNIEHFRSQLSGPYVFTRAYALSTLYFLNHTDNFLVPAVFISSHENQTCQKKWKSIVKKWDESFKNDQGNPDKILELRMICDGIWFSIMYNYGHQYKARMERIVRHYCRSLEKESF